jgi:hypothetical protein
MKDTQEIQECSSKTRILTKEERTKDKMKKRILTGGSNNIVIKKEVLAEGMMRINGKETNNPAL